MLDHIVVENGAYLVDIEVVGGVRNPILRLLVHKGSGTSVALCRAISAEAADLLDLEDPFPGSYRLEVTSPGLDRPLESDKDFSRAQDRLLKIITRSGKTIKGRLKEWNEQHLHLEVGKKKQRQDVDRREVAKATIEVEF